MAVEVHVCVCVCLCVCVTGPSRRGGGGAVGGVTPQVGLAASHQAQAATVARQAEQLRASRSLQSAIHRLVACAAPPSPSQVPPV